MRKEGCPAWGKICGNCKGRNHFKKKCKKVHAVSHSQSHEQSSDSSDSELDDNWLYAVHTKSKTIVSARMLVHDCEEPFQIDSAAETNTICKRFVRKEQVRETKTTLTMFNYS